VMRYPWSEGYILRASKLLAESDWLGGHYKLRFRSISETARYIERLGIRVVVIEEEQGTRPPEHQRLLLEAIRENPTVWQEARIPDNRARSDSSILVYLRTEGNGTPNGAVHSEMEGVLRGILGLSL